MFNKTSKPNRVEKAEPAAPPPLDLSSVNAPVAAGVKKPVAGMPTPKAGSVLSSSLTIHGNITGTGDLLLEGSVLGDVKAGHLIVGEAGNVEGLVEAEIIEIRGRVVGSITGKQVRLSATAYVEGDITHEQLSIDVGAYFVGRCLQSRRPDVRAGHEASTAPATPSVPPAATPAPSTFGTPSFSSYDMNALSDLKPSY